MGAAAPIIGGISAVAGLVGQSNSQSAQAQAQADQASMLAKQSFMNALALNSVQTNLAYDFDTADLQGRAADMAAVQQNFQNLMAARSQHLQTSGSVDQARYVAQKQYFDTLFQQAQQSTGTAVSSAQGMNNKFFQVGMEGLQQGGALTQAGMNNMFGVAVNAMNREQEASSQGLSNIFQSGAKGLTDTTNTALSGADNVFNTANAARQAFGTASVNAFDVQSQGFGQVQQQGDQLTQGAQAVQQQQQQLGQQQSALEASYAAMIGGGNVKDSLSGQNLRERTDLASTDLQQGFEQSANKALGNTMRQADYNTEQANLSAEMAGQLGLLGVGNAANIANLNNQNVGSLALLSNLNALGNYNRDTTFARSQGALDTQNASNQFGLQYNQFMDQNQLNQDYAGYENSVQNSFLRDFLTKQDQYTQKNAGNTLQGTNANLNNVLMQSLQQKQATEQAYQQGNYQIGSQSADNRMAQLMAMITGMTNARLQSDANATINQGQQAALRAQRGGGPGIGDYLNAGLGLANGIRGAIGGGGNNSNQMNYGFTPYNSSSFGYNPSSSGLFSNTGLYGNPSASYGYASPSLGLGTFQSSSF
jgi:hypothetical protein